MIDGVFAPARFLDLIRDFVLFESDGARTWKVMAKYHQVHAVERGGRVGRARRWAATSAAGWSGTRRVPGKSYTMVFFVNKLRRDPRFANPTIVAVTDRTDLDNQLARDVHRHEPGAGVSSRRRRSPADRRACTSC